MSQTTHVLRRVCGLLLGLTLLSGACSDAPEPGDLAAFCDLLDRGVGLSTTATEAEYAQLALVAPPEIRPTIDSLQTQARDFDELLNVEPPDLAAIFTAKFDPAAERDRAALDRYAASGCNLTVDRPPTTRWATYVRENEASAPWRDAIATQFEVSGSNITAATVSFSEVPTQMAQIEDVCEALADFLSADGSDQASLRILIDTVVVLEQEGADGPCQLP